MTESTRSAGRYHFAYSEESVYGHVMRLVREHARPGGVHLDLGCGFGAIAEKVAEFGLDYIGMDVDADGLGDLASRGFETAPVDLSDVPSTLAAIRSALGGRSVAAITLLDTLEHLVNGPALLHGLRELVDGTTAPLVVSVPNIAHRDIALKLLAGRFDYTDTGLLDRTHYVHHTEAHLASVMRFSGWRQVGSDDLQLTTSDQHSPASHALLNPGSTLHQFLADLRDQADSHAETNQFVRAYLPGSRSSESHDTAANDPPGPFLTVVLRTQGRRLASLGDALLCLSAQTLQDFEVLLTVHRALPADLEAVSGLVDTFPSSVRERTRLIEVQDGGRGRPLNLAIENSRGEYLAVLDDDDLVLGNWVEAFFRLARQRPGTVLRTVCVEQRIEPVQWPAGTDAFLTTSEIQNPYPSHFDLLAHLERNHTPFMSYAFPIGLFRDLGMRFDESLDVCEDWDFELRAALTVGVASASEVTAIYRRWQAGSSSASIHAQAEWRRAENAILARLDMRPQLFPAGTISAIRGAVEPWRQRVSDMEKQIQALVERNQEVEEQARRMEQSQSWRLTRPLRAIVRLLRGHA